MARAYKTAFNLDFGIVETMTHYTATRHFNEDVDFIIDIGGQDIKCFSIKDKQIDSIVLNEACSSGCGSFLQRIAENLGYDLKEFTNLAINQSTLQIGEQMHSFYELVGQTSPRDGANIEYKCWSCNERNKKCYL